MHANIDCKQVRFEEGPALPGKYAVHAFLAESKDAVAGSTGMFQCIFAFDAELARRKRCHNDAKQTPITANVGEREQRADCA